MATGPKTLSAARVADRLPLPDGAQRHVAELARFAQTPSAHALAAHFDAYPWVRDALDAFPHRNPVPFVVHGPWLGLGNCHKCNSCSIARLYALRRRYEPDEEGLLACEVGVAWA